MAEGEGAAQLNRAAKGEAGGPTGDLGSGLLSCGDVFACKDAGDCELLDDCGSSVVIERVTWSSLR